MVQELADHPFSCDDRICGKGNGWFYFEPICRQGTDAMFFVGDYPVRHRIRRRTTEDDEKGQEYRKDR